MSAHPPLRQRLTIEQYRIHFEAVYCHKPIITFDQIAVRFYKRDFDHCMYESSVRNKIKDQFSIERSERIDWIKATLENPNAILYQGWDKTKKTYDSARRVAVVFEDFVVVIALRANKKARFITAYLADNSMAKIRMSPKWV